MAFFRLDVNELINLQSGVFAATIYQQGNRLGKCRANHDRFEPSEFNMTLIQTKTGHSSTFLKSVQGDAFNLTMIVDKDDHKTLASGTYILVVDARWNKIANNHHAYKNISVSVESPGSLKISTMSFNHGMEALSKACVDNAKKKAEKNKHCKYYEGDFSNCFRIKKRQVCANSWIGYTFINNKATSSAYPLHETTLFKLKNVDLLVPHSHESHHGKKMEKVESEIKVGQSTLIMYRRNDNEAEIETKSLIRPRKITLEELEREVQDKGKMREVHPEYLDIKEHMHANHLGIYIQNKSKDTNLTITFEF